MLKQISFVVVASIAISGCGGSSGGSKSSSSSVVSSAPAVSSLAASSAVTQSSVVSSVSSSVAASASSVEVTPSSSSEASSDASSSSSSSSGAVISIDMTAGWRGNSGGDVAYSNEGVTFTGSGDGEGAVFDLVHPVNLKGAVIDFVINASSEYETSGASIQPFAQVKAGSYPGEYDCWADNSTLTPGSDQTISCTVDENAFEQTADDVQIGIQSKGTSFAGTVLIKSVTVTLASGNTYSSASSSSSSSAETSSSSSAPSGVYTFTDSTSLSNWTVNGGGSPNQLQLEFNTAGGSGINMVPVDWTENINGNGWKYEARFTLPTPIDITVGTQISFTLSIPQSYITDANAVLQVNWGIAGGTYSYGGAGGGYRTLSAAGGVSSTTDFVITETVASGAVAGATTVGLQISAVPTDTSIKDKILIKSVSVQ